MARRNPNPDAVPRNVASVAAPASPDGSADNASDAGPAAAGRRRAAFNRQRFFDIDLLHVTLRLGSYRAETLYWGVLGERWWRNYLHAHSFFEVCYAYAGKGEFRVRDTTLPVERGHLFLATPGVSHEIVSSRSSPLGIYFWAFTLLRMPDHDTTETDRPIDALIEALPASPRHVARRPDLSVDRTLELLNAEIANKAPGYTQAIHGLAAKLLLDGARAFTDGVAAEPLAAAAERSGARSAVHTAVRYLRDNYSRPIEVRDVAAQVHLSERHLSRLFARETGKSILEFLTDLRIEAASQLLLDDAIPIKQVARSVGYPDPHYFTTLFGRRTGLTPGVFRQRRGTRFRDESRRPLSLRRKRGG
jgi:AraC family L-rhamnose operon transcriptional activator RhaR